jgi:predicted glycosyltransferase
MRYLVFTNTPAHVHLYRNAVQALEARGHTVLVLARDYGCTVELLEWYDLPYEVYGRCDTTKGSLVRQLPRHYARMLRLARRYDPDLVFGMGSYSAHTGLVTRTPTILILDSEPTSIDHRISQPFADAILTPDAFRKDLGDDHYTFAGFKECAYLHPDRYAPQADIRERLGLDPEERYAVLRFNAFGSHHDFGKGGFAPDQRAELVERLAREVTVFVSDEGGGMDLSALPAREFDVHPALMHDALREASLVVADTQTVVTEAALLGTPVVRSNSFVGEDDMGNFIELEERGLVRNVASFERVRSTALDLLDDDAATDRWESRRRELLDETVDLTQLLVDVAETPNAVDSVTGVSQRVATPTEAGHSSTAD